MQFAKISGFTVLPGYMMKRGGGKMYSLHGIRSDKILLKYFFKVYNNKKKNGPQGYKTFFILNPAENEIYHANKC